MILKQKYIVFIPFLLLLLNGCRKEDQSRFQATWSSKDPVLTPYNVRKHEKALGNIVTNGSFESGKVYYEENNIESFDVNGWKKVGKNIEWVNINNNKYKNNEAVHGTHSIKITRNTADETEKEGCGILSDYIKVIPGNYSLRMMLKLKHVCPNQSRIGIKMYDAVNIRLYYFDKNKIELDGTEFNPFQNNKIDNTFKSLTLSNYNYIDSINWGEIHGKTAYFPFFDGDMPDKARYVKIFISLKGYGQMWIDNVDFRYTDKNFTLRERLAPYYDSSYSAYDQLIPQPKIVVPKTKLEFYKPNKNIVPVILIPEDAGKKLVQYSTNLGKLITSKIKNYDNNFTETNIVITNNLKKNQIPDNKIIISIGNTQLYNRNKTYLPDSVLKEHKQAYYIQTLEGKPNIIYINASDIEGFKYSFYTFSQLFDNEKPELNNATIIDYPDFKQRAYLIHGYQGSMPELREKLQLFEHYKLDISYFELYKDTDKAYPLNFIDSIITNKGIESYNIMIDLLKSGKESITVRESADYINKLNNALKHPNSLLLSGQYFQPGNYCSVAGITFYNNENHKEHLQEKHANLLNFLYKNTGNIGCIEFIAPWNRLEIIDKGLGRAEFYYHDLINHIPEDISLYWTGGSYCSQSIDYAEFKRINNIYGRVPAFLDNSLQANELRFKSNSVKNYYAGKLRVLSLFEPYTMDAFSNFPNVSKNNKIVLNINSLSEIETIRILTASDYYWNTRDYNPEHSLWIILCKLYGQKNAITLINYSDAYYGLSEICQKIKINGLQHKNQRIANIFASRLKKNYNTLKKELKNEKLLEEIKLLNNEILNTYNRSILTSE